MSFFIHKKSENVLVLKDAVATFNDISTTYSTPEIDWGVQAIDTQKLYRWNGLLWEYIIYSSLDDIVASDTPPLNRSNWIDTSV